jgi:ubiquinone/menaquinone biosynthesis C-methylase UbiE
VALARAIFEAMDAQVAWDPAWRVLDAGAGTGLLGLAVLPHVARVTAVDASAKMLEVLAAKATGLPLETHLCPLEALDLPAASFDAVVSSMALHHVADVPAALAGFARVLRPAVGPLPGGHLLLADLDLEPGTFHSDNTGVHHLGFDREALGALLVAAGFTAPTFVTALENPKIGADGVLRNYPVFCVHTLRR